MISGIGITDGLVPCSQQYWNNYKFSETIKINPRNQLKSKSNAFLPDTHFSTQTRWNEFHFNAQTQRLWGSLTEDSQSNSISDSYTLTHNETQWDQQLSLKSKSAIILEIEIWLIDIDWQILQYEISRELISLIRCHRVSWRDKISLIRDVMRRLTAFSLLWLQRFISQENNIGRSVYQ